MTNMQIEYQLFIVTITQFTKSIHIIFLVFLPLNAHIVCIANNMPVSIPVHFPFFPHFLTFFRLKPLHLCNVLLQTLQYCNTALQTSPDKYYNS
jgi:hypothetical protein